MNPAPLAALDGFDSPDARRKRLGQYFSGPRVARLLVALAASRSVTTAADPMAGRADLLAAVAELVPSCRRLDAVEIDPYAHAACSAVLRAQQPAAWVAHHGSAFDPAIATALSADGYDLVVTNPPYVRYQSQRQAAGSSTRLPSALEVRDGLRQCLGRLASLTDDDRGAFLTLATHYSGLSDLAVPSWLLCAALVKAGGRLAMVLPDAWLNRDYAAVVQYLLQRWFRIEYIVEDAHAAWFPDAQVKTTLLVAQRIAGRTSMADWKDEAYVHIELPADLATADSLIGRSRFASEAQPELAFAAAAARLLQGEHDARMEGVRWQRLKLADRSAALGAVAESEAWYRQLEPQAGQVVRRPVAPPALRQWLGAYDDFVTLPELGVEVGQGLRTGANDFFYVDVVHRGKRTSTVRLSAHFDAQELSVPNACLRAAVRKQADLAGRFAVEARRLGGAALAFQGWALPEHARAAQARAMPPGLAQHVTRAAKSRTGAGPGAKRFPELSAVATNARDASPERGTPARYWYMLPDFAPRHSPELLVARVNAEQPLVARNAPGVLADANFSTLWRRPGSGITANAVLALLNSTLAAALFEHLGSVMGGGALKLEATHLRVMPIPRLTAGVLRTLDALGRRLCRCESAKRPALVELIDHALLTGMFGRDAAQGKREALTELTQRRRAQRLR